MAELFSGFNDHGDPQLMHMHRECVRFVESMASADVPGYWLSLLGPSGTGKTMLARCINRVFQRKIEGAIDELRSSPNQIWRRAGGFLGWPKCIDYMLDSDFGFMRQACEDWFLVLDDVGAEHAKMRELSSSKLFSILNARQGKFTVLTANLGIDEIADKLDPRIASRLLRHGGTVVDTTGIPDYGIRMMSQAEDAA